MLDDLNRLLLTVRRWALIVLAGCGLAGLAWLVWRWVG